METLITNSKRKRGRPLGSKNGDGTRRGTTDTMSYFVMYEREEKLIVEKIVRKPALIKFLRALDAGTIKKVWRGYELQPRIKQVLVV